MLILEPRQPRRTQLVQALIFGDFSHGGQHIDNVATSHATELEAFIGGKVIFGKAPGTVYLSYQAGMAFEFHIFLLTPSALPDAMLLQAGEADRHDLENFPQGCIFAADAGLGIHCLIEFSTQDQEPATNIMRMFLNGAPFLVLITALPENSYHNLVMGWIRNHSYSSSHD